MEQVLAIIYGIWHARNMKVFQDKYIPPLEVFSKALSLLHEFQSFGKLASLPNLSCVSSACSNNNSWNPPLRGTLKVNVDAHLSSDGRWFAGMILRLPDGTNDVLMGWGLNDAIDWIEEIGVSQVCFELDSQILVNAVKDVKLVRKGWENIVCRCACANFINNNPNADIGWVRRSGNQAAHELAIWAEEEPNKIWPNFIPNCILHIIQKEMGYVFFA